MLKLSIITVNLNNAEGLRKTIDSVINQTYTHFEHIIIDGGSTDGSVEVIKEYEAIYKEKQRHLYWVSEPDKGIYNGMNKGIKVARGEYCLFLNSGDYLYKDGTLDNWSNFEIKDEQIIYGDILFQGHSYSQIRKYPNIVSLDYLTHTSLPHQSMFIKTDLFNKIGLYNETFKITADWEFYTKAILKLEVSYLHINKIISVSDIYGISNDLNYKDLHIQEKKIAMRNIFPETIWIAGRELVETKNKLNGLLGSRSVKWILYINKKLKRK